jgi:hypothetical protein
MLGRWFGLIFLFLISIDSKISHQITKQRILGPSFLQRNASLIFSPKTTSLKKSLVAGGLARMVAQTTLHPLDAMRTHTQLRIKDPTLPLLPSSLLKGIVPQIIFSGPAGALQFSVLEVLKALHSLLFVCLLLVEM